MWCETSACPATTLMWTPTSTRRWWPSGVGCHSASTCQQSRRSTGSRCGCTGSCQRLRQRFPDLHRSWENRAEVGLAVRVVKDLVRPIDGRFHIANMDNYFSSPELFCDLLETETYARGTVRADRKQFPKDSLHKKCVAQQGEMKVRQKGPLVSTAWKDKKVITLFSTADCPLVRSNVEHRKRDGTRTQVACPSVVKAYNDNMNGVDRADQLRTEYPTYRNSKKWWHYLFWFLFDTAVANAFVLMKESAAHAQVTKTGRPKELRQLNFPMNLAKLLIGQVRSQRKRRLVSAVDPTGTAHLPQKGSNGRCRNCSRNGIRKESKVKCTACAHSLCIDCFVPFHCDLMG